MPFVDSSFIIPPAGTQTVTTSVTRGQKISPAIFCVCVQLGVFYLLALKIIIAYNLCMCLWCIWECSQAIFIICSFPSGPHVTFVYIGLHIEGDIIHPCTSKVHVCVHASSLLHSSLHVCAACSCLCYTKMSQCCGLFFCTQHISVCMLILPWWFNHVLGKEGSTASQWRIFILDFHFQKLFQDDALPLWKGKKVVHLTKLFTSIGSCIMLLLY